MCRLHPDDSSTVLMGRCVLGLREPEAYKEQEATSMWGLRLGMNSLLALGLIFPTNKPKASTTLCLKVVTELNVMDPQLVD